MALDGPTGWPRMPSIVFGEPTPALLLSKAIGAIAGSLISLAYVLPRGRREAMLRLSVGVVSGLVFGSTAGIKIADAFGLLGRISGVEVTLMGATFTSLSAWWALGVLQRLAERNSLDALGESIVTSMKAADRKDTHKGDR